MVRKISEYGRRIPKNSPSPFPQPAVGAGILITSSIFRRPPWHSLQNVVQIEIVSTEVWRSQKAAGACFSEMSPSRSRVRSGLILRKSPRNGHHPSAMCTGGFSTGRAAATAGVLDSTNAESSVAVGSIVLSAAGVDAHADA